MLFYQKYTGKGDKHFKPLHSDNEGDEELLEEDRNEFFNIGLSQDVSTSDEMREKLKLAKKRTISMKSTHSLGHIEENSVGPEACMSMAIPFARKTTKTFEVDSDEEAIDFENAPAHMLLPDAIYYPVTLGLFALVVGSACVIKDVESVIKYIGSLGNSILNFLIPGITYYIIMGRNPDENVSKLKRYGALGLALYGGGLAII